MSFMSDLQNEMETVYQQQMAERDAAIVKLQTDNTMLEKDLQYLKENYEYILNDEWNENSDIAKRIIEQQFKDFIANYKIQEGKEIAKIRYEKSLVEERMEKIRLQNAEIIAQKDVERQAEVAKLNLQFSKMIDDMRKDYEYKIQREKIRWEDLATANTTFINNRKKQDAKFSAAQKLIEVIKDLFISCTPTDPDDFEDYTKACFDLESAINDDSEANYDTSIDKRVDALEGIIQNLETLFVAIEETRNKPKDVLNLFTEYAKLSELYSQYKCRFR